MNNYLTGIMIIGCCLILVVYWLISAKYKQQQQQIERLANDKKILKDENNYLKINLREVKEIKDRITAIELRQDQADLWFGSIIRHSRAQFDKEAVEKFIDEHGIKEEEE